MEFIPAPEAPSTVSDLPSSVLIAIVVIAGLILVYSFFAFSRNRAKVEQQWREENIARNASMRSVAQKFIIPESARFKAKPVVSTKSLQILELLENLIWDVNSSFSVLIHISMDQFLEQETSSNPVEQERTQQSMRLETMDYLVVNSNGLPVLAVMYYREGPTQSQRKPDDLSTQTIIGALNRAGIRFFEIEPGFSQRDLKKRLKRMLNSGIL
ncbi:MAG: DUF2726 domain-containing protein [Rhodobacteraceae bacterium]|nr:DUF2726 domain-containing protein [Paracoccaceae bacterium]